MSAGPPGVEPLARGGADRAPPVRLVLWRLRTPAGVAVPADDRARARARGARRAGLDTVGVGRAAARRCRRLRLDRAKHPIPVTRPHGSSPGARPRLLDRDPPPPT